MGHQNLKSISSCIVCGANRWHNVPALSQTIRSLFHAQVIRCDRCGLGLLEPMPSQDEADAIYASESYAQSYDQVGQDFVVSEKTAHQQLQPRFAKLAAYLPSKGNMLDIGASRGVFLRQAALQGWSIFGLEAGMDSVQFAKKNLGIQIEHGVLVIEVPNEFGEISRNGAAKTAAR